MKSLILLLILTSGIVYSDVLPEGKKKISFYFEVSGLENFPDYVFLAYPVNQSNGVPDNECIILEEGKPVYLSCKYNSPAIYAVKKELFNPDNIKTDKTEKIENTKLDSFFANNKNIMGTKEIGCETFADRNAGYNSITDYYKIVSIENNSLTIEKVKSVKNDKSSKDEGYIDDNPGSGNSARYLYYSLPALSLIALVTFVLARKRKKL